jgi:hypothetical protein
MASRDARYNDYCDWSAKALVDRLVNAEDALKEAKADSSYFEEWATANGHRLNASLAQCDRYRSAWLSARRRSGTEAQYATEALALRDAEIVRLKADLAKARQSTSAAANPDRTTL